MNKTIIVFTLLALAIFLCCSVVVSVNAADAIAAESVVQESITNKVVITDISPEILTDKYSKYVTQAKDLLFKHGPGLIAALLILVIGRIDGLMACIPQ